MLILSDSSLFAFIPSLPLPLVRVSMHMVSILCNPLTCQCDGAGWVAATHKVVMDTLHVLLGLIHSLTLLFRHYSPSSSIVDEFRDKNAEPQGKKCHIVPLSTMDTFLFPEGSHYGEVGLHVIPKSSNACSSHLDS